MTSNKKNIPNGWNSINKATSKTMTLNILGVIGLLVILILPLWLVYFINNDFIPISDGVQLIILIIVSLCGVSYLFIAFWEANNIKNNNQMFPKFYMAYLTPGKNLTEQIIDNLKEEKLKRLEKKKYFKGLGKMDKLILDGHSIFILENQGLINDTCAVYAGPINDHKSDFEFIQKIDQCVSHLKKFQDPKEA